MCRSDFIFLYYYVCPINYKRALITMSKEKQRIYGLDIMRAVAILLVIQSHSLIFLKSHFIIFGDGVSVFFVLSGFLIGQILLRTINTRPFNMKDLFIFYIKRWFRTLPAYYFVITTLIAIYFFLGTLCEKTQLIEHYFFIQKTYFRSFYPESWSLKIEEWFYFIIPFLLYLSFKILKIEREKIFLYWVVIIILVGTLLRILLAIPVENAQDWFYPIRLNLPGRIDSIMYGMLGAYIYFKKLLFWQYKIQLFYSGLLIFCICAINANLELNFFTKYFQTSLESISVLFILPKLHDIKDGKGIFFNFFTYVSSISYSMYLINGTPFMNLVRSTQVKVQMVNLFHDAYPFVELLFYMIWCFGGSYLIYKFIESPMINIREKFVRQLERKFQRVGD